MANVARIDIEDIAIEYVLIKTEMGFGSSFDKNEFLELISYYEEMLKKKNPDADNKIYRSRLFKETGVSRYANYFDVITDGREENPLYKLNNNLEYHQRRLIHNYIETSDYLNPVQRLKDSTEVEEMKTIITNFLSNKKNKMHSYTTNFTEPSSETEAMVEAFSIIVAGRITYEKKYFSIKGGVLAGNLKPNIKGMDRGFIYYDLSSLELPRTFEEELCTFSNLVYKRLKEFYTADPTTVFCSNRSNFIGRANYENLFSGYVEIIDEIFGNNLIIDLQNFALTLDGDDDELHCSSGPEEAEFIPRDKLLRIRRKHRGL